VSDAVVLTLRSRLDRPLDVSGVTPDRCAGLSQDEIAALPVWAGATRVALGDVFDIRGERALRLEIEGDLRNVHGLGAGTAAGEVSVRGDAGRETGARMTGGLVHVHGSTGDDAGQAMAGGVLRVDGHAGDRLASAAPGAAKGVTGGEIVVLGTAGDGAAALMRRGLVAVAGGVGPFAGRGMIAGTLLVLGPIGDQAGLGNKRGSIIAGAGVTVPPTYRLACTYEPPHVRLLLTSLRRRFAFPADASLLAGPYDRYCGDAGEVGKGEILVWTGRARSPRG
jgi:formylmethanofuran dehydrogenase subunit C